MFAIPVASCGRFLVDVERDARSISQHQIDRLRRIGVHRVHRTAQIEAPKRRGRKARTAPASAPASKKATAARRGPKSSPEEVEALGEKILDLLKKEGETMASSDMRKRLHVHEGQFTYALNKLKEDGRVEQVGERRMARYGLGTPKGAKAKAPRKKPGRKPKAEAPAGQAPAGDAEG